MKFAFIQNSDILKDPRELVYLPIHEWMMILYNAI